MHEQAKQFEKIKRKKRCEGATVARSSGQLKAGGRGRVGTVEKRGVLAVIGPKESSQMTTKGGDKRRQCDRGRG